MKLIAIVDDRQHAIEVPSEMLQEAEDFFRKMDRDMDRGWRMGPEYIENPDQVQRCQIAADRLLGALSSANETMTMLMAGYILKRLPDVRAVRIDTGGELLNTELLYDDNRAPASASGHAPPPPPPVSGRLDRLEAMEQAGKDVTRVYRVGRSFRFAVYDHVNRRWIESPLMDDEGEAAALRMQAVKRRFDELTGTPAPLN